jgi:hypothetical protein
MLIDTNLIGDYSIAQLRELKRIAREELERRHWRIATKRHSTRTTAELVRQSKAVLERE